MLAALVTFAPSNRNWMLPGTTAVPRSRMISSTVPAGGKFAEFFDGLADAIHGPVEAALVVGTKSTQLSCKSPISTSWVWAPLTSLAVSRTVFTPCKASVWRLPAPSVSGTYRQRVQLSVLGTRNCPRRAKVWVLVVLPEVTSSKRTSCRPWLDARTYTLNRLFGKVRV